MEKETLEESAENYGWKIKTNTFSNPVKANELAESAKQDFIEGAKWQAEQEQSAFVKKDDVDGEWLSPVATERVWQEEQLVNIFGHYPNASPRWQYMNGLILNSLQAERMYSEEDVINAFNEGQALNVRGKLIQGKEWFEQFKKK